MINLISDTVTKPSPAMMQAMMQAEVGDDVFGQDPTVNRLQEKAAALFGKEAAVFCPSGTMTNQIAVQVHCGRLEEVLCDGSSHVYQYETGGYAYNARAAIKLLPGLNGKIDPGMIRSAVNPDFDWLPTSRLVVVENSCNRGGGTIYTLREMRAISDCCQELDLRSHLDGARIFNVLVETGDSSKEVGILFDSISICLSKGLGAPVGSLLIGDEAFIKQARRLRKVMGGGMRQAGFLAAAGIYALDQHVDRLKVDNDRAKQIGTVLEDLSFVKGIRPVQTNILIFDLIETYPAEKFVAEMERRGILCYAFGPTTVRLVTHLDVREEDYEHVFRSLEEMDRESGVSRGSRG